MNLYTDYSGVSHVTASGQVNPYVQGHGDLFYTPQQNYHMPVSSLPLTLAIKSNDSFWPAPLPSLCIQAALCTEIDPLPKEYSEFLHVGQPSRGLAEGFGSGAANDASM